MPKAAAMDDIPLVIEFVAHTVLLLERDRVSELPIVGNGRPGSFVLFPDGLRVSLPTDQIVFADESAGCVRVGFGGMRFVGCEDRHLVFVRFRELYPEGQLSPARSHTMRLDPRWVATITAEGSCVWPVDWPADVPRSSPVQH